ncbi:DUF928 domain-containing protein [Gloeothece verrucosa]|uniref:DUF928 domain-containing protein n=1 Tax=Gloeothece verrucosa (strain PCC 7822) TaxID=497965 RepID=E0UG32_GLOV7|nr:DUF928 domain-containing protein [Gloeothece verrucosa]ADN15533.1 protein of unknown function DUF928 [Gloeothece verrucosa PCC 7822]
MTFKNFNKQLILLLILVESVTIIYSGLLLAKENAPINKNPKIVFKPPESAKPRTSVGGASRRDEKCPEDAQQIGPFLTAVIPANQQALTLQDHPTVLVYLPATSTEVAFFSITEETSSSSNKQQHYQTFFPLPKKAGIIRLKLPADAFDLQIGKTYKWSFVMMCNNKLRPDNPSVAGTIERVALSSTLTEQLKQAKPLEQAALYGEFGLWYDAINTLAKLREADPNNSELMMVWQDLLNSATVGLNMLAKQPLVH